MEIVKTLHVKFFPFGSLLPSRAVTVKNIYFRFIIFTFFNSCTNFLNIKCLTFHWNRWLFFRWMSKRHFRSVSHTLWNNLWQDVFDFTLKVLSNNETRLKLTTLQALQCNPSYRPSKYCSLTRNLHEWGFEFRGQNGDKNQDCSNRTCYWNMLIEHFRYYHDDAIITKAPHEKFRKFEVYVTWLLISC